MFRYLKAAFFLSPELPAMGKVPWNILALVCVGILGLANIGFWFLGLGLEAVYLLGLAGNKRFQRMIDAEAAGKLEQDTAKQTQCLIEQLKPASRQKLLALADKRGQITQLYRSTATDGFVVDANSQALSDLSWVYLKLLIAQNTLESPQSRANEEKLGQQIQALNKELETDKLSPSLRESKLATLRICEKRLENLARREQSLQEIASDLTRIEAQVDLALENAQMQGRPQAISVNLDLASHTLDDGIYGDAESAIAELDEKFQRRVKMENRLPA